MFLSPRIVIHGFGVDAVGGHVAVGCLRGRTRALIEMGGHFVTVPKKPIVFVVAVVVVVVLEDGRMIGLIPGSLSVPPSPVQGASKKQ